MMVNKKKQKSLFRPILSDARTSAAGHFGINLDVKPSLFSVDPSANLIITMIQLC